METKLCSKCKTEKELSEFYKDKSKKTGYRNACKQCEGNKNTLKPIKEIENEIWVDIVGYENKYQVSNLGRVRNISKKIKYEIVPNINLKGYFIVGLSKNGIRETKTIHRLVAIAFIPNVLNKEEVDHINTIRTDNRVENLRWVTHKENCNNSKSIINYSNMRKGKTTYSYTKEQREAVSRRMKGFKHKEESKNKMSEKRKGSKNPRALKVFQYSLNGDFIKEWEYAKQASKELNVDYNGLISCCKGKRKTAGGFIWSYERR